MIHLHDVAYFCYQQQHSSIVVNKEGAHNVVDDYFSYFVSTIVLFLMYLWHLICHIMFPNFICIFLYFTLVHGLYILMVLIIIYFLCT